MAFLQRTVTCGELRPEHAGQTVILNGWVHSRRDLGGMAFVDIRDRYGITQFVVEPTVHADVAALARELRSEFVVAVKGTVRMRQNPNPNMPTGLIEVVADELQILNRAELPPFDIGDEGNLNEELRLKYRYLDLRRPLMQRIFIVRHQVMQIIHSYFAEHGFVEIETPVLMKSTPEGARDYLVPSRLHHGRFYALPQSPQIYKQLLMVAGFDRYVQIVKCFRDEDLRADRQPEFTQIDLEMSFVTQEDVLTITEGMLARIWKEVKGVDLSLPLPRLTYQESMSRYGTDKPDTRFGLELHELNDIFAATEFGVAKTVLASGGAVAGVNFSGGASYSRKQIDELTEHVRTYGAKGLVWLKVTATDLEGGSAKFLTEQEKTALRERLAAKEGDLLLIVADEWRTCHIALGALRNEISRREQLVPKGTDNLLFIVDFPMFEEIDATTGKPVPAHHPFTSVRPEDEHLLDTDPLKARANCYDLVINGYELASGSIRIHDRAMQEKIFDLIGLTEEEASKKFGFLLDAFRYGAPPHGGIAPGLDRLIMILAGTDNIRDVIAFPKTTSAMSLMDNAPSEVATQQLRELGLQILDKKQ